MKKPEFLRFSDSKEYDWELKWLRSNIHFNRMLLVLTLTYPSPHPVRAVSKKPVIVNWFLTFWLFVMYFWIINND